MISKFFDKVVFKTWVFWPYEKLEAVSIICIFSRTWRLCYWNYLPTLDIYITATRLHDPWWFSTAIHSPSLIHYTPTSKTKTVRETIKGMNYVNDIQFQIRDQFTKPKTIVQGKMQGVLEPLAQFPKGKAGTQGIHGNVTNCGGRITKGIDNQNVAQFLKTSPPTSGSPLTLKHMESQF